MRLHEIERLFYELVTAPEGVQKGLEQRGLQTRDLERMVRDDARLSAVARLDIYANMYFYRIADVLRDDFPKVQAVIGEAEFHNLITDYLLARPPTHFSLRNAGQHFAEFIAAHPLNTPWPWLSPLGQLERKRVEVFDAADTPALTVDELRSIDPERFATLPLRLIAAHALVEADYDVGAVWDRIEHRIEEGEAPGIERCRSTLLVWRAESYVYHRPLDEHEQRLWPLLREGASLGLVCEALAAERDSAEATSLAFTLLGRWVGDGLIAA